MISREDIIEIGVFNKPHGVMGEISATVDCDLEEMKRFSCVITDVDGIYVPFFVTNYRNKTRNTILLTFDGLKNENEVSLLTNKPIYVKKTEYETLLHDSESDEYSLDFFVGYEVKDVDDNVLGVIDEVDATTENVLFRIRNNQGNEILLPAVEEFIAGLDNEQRRMIVDLPEGLLDL